MSEEGRPLVPCVVTASGADGSPALPVVGYTSAPTGRAVEGAPMLPVVIISAADVAAGYPVLGQEPVPMVLGSAVGSRATLGQRPVPVVVVSGSLNPTPPPTAPTSLTATPAGPTSINLSWPAVAGATSYTIYRLTGYSGTPAVSVGTSGTNSFSDTGLTPGDGYTYAVTASNVSGESGQSPTATAVAGMSARWTLDNTGAGYIDLIGGLTLAPIGTAPGTATGIIGDAANLGGTGALSVADNIALRGSLAGFTVEVWARPGSVAGTQQILTKDGSGTGNREWAIYTSGVGLDFAIWNSATVAISTFTNSLLTLNTWVHIVGTFDGTRARLYTNGVLRATSGVFSGSFISSSRPAMRVGAIDNATRLYFTGREDEVAVYQGVALSAAQVTTRYNSGAGRRP